MGLTTIIVVVVIVLSLMPNVNVPEQIPFRDKGAHFLAYVAVAFSFYFCFFRIDGKNFRGVLLAFLLSTVLGVAIEFLQPFFGRAREFADFLVDAGGSALGVLISVLAGMFLKKMDKNAAERNNR